MINAIVTKCVGENCIVVMHPHARETNSIYTTKIAKVEEITMDEPNAGKLACVVLTEGEDKNPIEILRCAKLHI